VARLGPVLLGCHHAVCVVRVGLRWCVVRVWAGLARVGPVRALRPLGRAYGPEGVVRLGRPHRQRVGG
jgi:hypothetical protein